MLLIHQKKVGVDDGVSVDIDDRIPANDDVPVIEIESEGNEEARHHRAAAAAVLKAHRQIRTVNHHLTIP